MSAKFLFNLKYQNNKVIDLNGSTLENYGNQVAKEQGVFGGSAIKFDGTNAIKIIKDRDNFVTPQEYTVSLWFKCSKELHKNAIVFALYSESKQLLFYSYRDGSTTAYITDGVSKVYSLGVNVVNNEWHHIAITCKNDTQLVFVDGKLCLELSETVLLTSLNNMCIGSDYSSIALSGFHTSGVIDNFVILNKALWNSNFTPPNHYFTIINQVYLSTTGAVYGMSNGTFQQLATDWNALSNEEKVALFTATNGETPTVDELKTIGKFKILTYSEYNNLVECTVSAVPKDQLVLPKKLINLGGYEVVHSIAVTSATTTSNSSVKVAFTKDLTTYIAYNKETATWQNVDATDVNTFSAGAMDASEVANIPEAKIAELGMKGFAIAYALSETNVADNCAVAALTIVADKKASWNKAVYGTDATYSYPNPDVLKVKLLTNGSYKINYNAGEANT
nr:MAG TPA: Concanavalin A-like lectin/glucanase superfamily protein [Caudoviricetes sp.]